MSLSASASTEAPVPLILRYFDLALVIVAAPILLLIGVSPLGYAVGGGVWIVLRAAGIVIERTADAAGEQRTQIGLRLGYMLGRLFALALSVILARSAGGRDAGLAALGVVVVAFTVELALSAITRGRRTR